MEGSVTGYHIPIRGHMEWKTILKGTKIGCEEENILKI